MSSSSAAPRRFWTRSTARIPAALRASVTAIVRTVSTQVERLLGEAPRPRRPSRLAAFFFRRA
eukprot:11208649-Lingulodinium_polyedra.AAC.1